MMMALSQSMTPCVQARCDQKYAYIGTNALPHYDFVQTTPNALVENDLIYRIPLAPAGNGSPNADDGAAIDGCVDAYDQYLTDPNTATTRASRARRERASSKVKHEAPWGS